MLGVHNRRRDEAVGDAAGGKIVGRDSAHIILRIDHARHNAVGDASSILGCYAANVVGCGAVERAGILAADDYAVVGAGNASHAVGSAGEGDVGANVAVYNRA